MLGVVLLAQLDEVRVDLHCVDVAGALGQGDADVVARPGPDDEHVVERAARHVPVEKEVEVLDPVQGRDGVQGLVRDVVGRDDELPLAFPGGWTAVIL